MRLGNRPPSIREQAAGEDEAELRDALRPPPVRRDASIRPGGWSARVGARETLVI